MKSLTGKSIPCIEAKEPGIDDAGYAVLKSPRHPTEFLVTPAVFASGIEAPVAATEATKSMWQAAWETRAYVADRLNRSLSSVDVGLVVNSKGSRTQDEFHIHVDCISEEARRAVDVEGLIDPNVWRALSTPIDSRRFWIERIPVTNLNSLNMVAEVLHLPEAAQTLRRVSAAVFPGGDLAPGSVFLLISLDDKQGENLLDHACRSIG